MMVKSELPNRPMNDFPPKDKTAITAVRHCGKTISFSPLSLANEPRKRDIGDRIKNYRWAQNSRENRVVPSSSEVSR